MEKVALLVSCCVILAHVLGSHAQYSLMTYTQQCPGSRGNSFPSSTYSQDRHLSNKVEDSLLLHRGVLIKSGERYAGFYNSSSLSDRKVAALKQLLKLMKFRARIPTGTTTLAGINMEIATAPLQTVLDLACQLLKKHFTGPYRTFECTPAELKLLEYQLEYSDILNKNVASISSLTTQSTHYYNLCSYWNSRMYENCTGYSPNHFELQISYEILRPLYHLQCSCRNIPICQVSFV